MNGIHKITISNSSVKYEFDIKRNITIIKGDSATGKTTLVEMIGEYYESGESSGINLVCDKSCRVLAGRDWSTLLLTIKDSIVFIDEDNDFMISDDFARMVRDSDNYYVIVTREGLPNLPYSVDEIYGIRSSGKYAGLFQVYHEFYHIYGDHTPDERVIPHTVMVEDSNSGYDFFKGLSDGKDYEVISAGGKSKIFTEILENKRDGSIVVIADGAAFGAEIDRISKLVGLRRDIVLFLPESFEWLILYSGVLKNRELEKIMKRPNDHIESRDYFSWERYFTHLLMEMTKDSYLKYSKNRLNPVYLHDGISQRIRENIRDIEL